MSRRLHDAELQTLRQSQDAQRALPRMHAVLRGAEAGRLAYRQASAANLGASHFIVAAADPAPAMDYPQLEIRIGDEVVESLGISRLGLIKIDVEGLELAVLEGLKRTLASQDPVVMFEAHPEVDRAAAEATVEFLRKLGFIHLYSCERPRMPRWPRRITRAPLNPSRRFWRLSPTICSRITRWARQTWP